MKYITQHIQFGSISFPETTSLVAIAQFCRIKQIKRNSRDCNQNFNVFSKTQILITSCVDNVKQRNRRHFLLNATRLRSYIMGIHRKYAIRVNQVISVDQVPEASIEDCKSLSKKMVFSVIFSAFIFIIKIRFVYCPLKRQELCKLHSQLYFFIHFFGKVCQLITLEQKFT